MTEILGHCDKKQYEHCGPHPHYADVGQRLPPFACVNWKLNPKDANEETATREKFLSEFRKLLKLHNATIDAGNSIDIDDVLIRGIGWYISLVDEAQNLEAGETTNA